MNAKRYAKYKALGVCPSHTNCKAIPGYVCCQECVDWNHNIKKAAEFRRKNLKGFNNQ
jgi:hypothetical protein